MKFCNPFARKRKKYDLTPTLQKYATPVALQNTRIVEQQWRDANKRRPAVKDGEGK